MAPLVRCCRTRERNEALEQQTATSADPDAMAACAAHVGRQPTDQLASFHLKRLLNGATGTRIATE
jgi:hypothetical protein